MNKDVEKGDRTGRDRSDMNGSGGEKEGNEQRLRWTQNHRTRLDGLSVLDGFVKIEPDSLYPQNSKSCGLLVICRYLPQIVDILGRTTVNRGLSAM